MASNAPSRKRIGTPDWDQLIPDLKGYLDPGPTEPEVWAYCESNIKVAVGFSELFWPPFCEWRGMIFTCERDADFGDDWARHVADWMQRLEGNETAVERMLNHVHLHDIFGVRDTTMEPGRMAYLGRVLQDMWSAKLKVDFPAYDCRVDLYLPDDDIDEWQITFYRVRDAADPGAAKKTS